MIKDGLIVTMDEENHIYDRGHVVIENNRIREVGESAPEKKAEETIDASGKIVMPGLICSHTYIPRILLRAVPLKIESPSDFSQILRRVWWNVDEEMVDGEDQASALAACLEFIKTGTTCFAGVHSGVRSVGRSLDRIASAVDEAGLRAFVSFEATERNTRAEGARGMRENVRFLKKLRREKRRRKRVQGMVSLHVSFTVSDELLQSAKRVSKRYEVPMLIPASEGRIDLYHNLEHYGKRTVERFYDRGLLSPLTVLAQCVHVNDDELSLIEKTETRVVHDPIENMMNGVGVARVPDMLERGISVGLGSGGYRLDAFENMRSAYLIHKAFARDPRVITPIEIMKMSTIKGAELYGLSHKLGSIEPGKLADIIILDPSSFPTPLRRENVINHIVNSVNAYDVQTVIVDGRVLMRNRKVLTLDEKEVLRKSTESSKSLWKKIGAIKR